MLDQSLTPSAIVKRLDRVRHRPGRRQADVAVAVYSHFRKIAQRDARRDLRIAKSNMLLIGSSGTGKTLMCETLSRILDVPFVTAEATSLAQTRYVNEEIEAILQRLVDKAGGDIDAAQPRHRVHRRDRQAAAPARRGARHVGRERAARAAQDHGRRAGQARRRRYLDTTNILFICGGAFVGLDEIMSQTHGYGFIATSNADNQKILDRLNSRVKPTDLFTYGLIPEFTGRLPIIARFQDLDRARCSCAS